MLYFIVRSRQRQHCSQWPKGVDLRCFPNSFLFRSFFCDYLLNDSAVISSVPGHKNFYFGNYFYDMINWSETFSQTCDSIIVIALSPQIICSTWNWYVNQSHVSIFMEPAFLGKYLLCWCLCLSYYCELFLASEHLLSPLQKRERNLCALQTYSVHFTYFNAS